MKKIGRLLGNLAMKKLGVVGLAGLFLAGGVGGAAQTPPAKTTPTITSKLPSELQRGALVTVQGSNMPTDTAKILVTLTALGAKCPCDTDQISVDLPANSGSGCSSKKAQLVKIALNPVTADAGYFTFEVPRETSWCKRSLCLPLGAYAVQVKFLQENVTVPVLSSGQDGSVQLVSASGNEVTITAVHPVTNYPDDGPIGFHVLGQGFSKVPEDNILVFEDRGEIRLTWVPEGSGPEHDKDFGLPPYGQVISSREMVIRGLPENFSQGQVRVRVRVGENTSGPFQIILSEVSYSTPAWISAGVLAALILVLLLLVRKGVGRYRIADKTYGIAKAFFIDPETDTYSLSKFQFYWWTAIAIFGYAYLTTARSLIQGIFQFAPIPGGLPGILMISASTKVLAQGVTGAMGPKGAGNIQPSCSDFVTSGGVVAADRVQFLVWTLAGGIGWLFLTLLRDPGNIQDLPNLPNGFLELMGVSSFGYLGGKFVRKPGPIIDEIVPTSGNLNLLDLKIRGRNLSRNASFLIENDPVTSETIVGGSPTLDEKEKEDETQGPDMAKVLGLKITTPKPKWLRNRRDGTKPRLTLINPDGQKAEWYYDGPISITISPTTATVGTSKTQQFTAEVKGLADTAVEWSIDPKTQGSIDTSGKYTAPTAIPKPSTIKVIATSKADSTLSASADVTIT